MEFGFIDVLKLIGALGFFIFGMKIMSEGIQKAAGNSLRRILSMMTKNRYLGVLTGFLVTCLVQSSSASTVMAVSFVNAGLLSLVESAGIMLGANIGTTITGWLVAVLGFKVKIAAMALPLLAVGVPMLFMKRNKNVCKYKVRRFMVYDTTVIHLRTSPVESVCITKFKKTTVRIS